MLGVKGLLSRLRPTCIEGQPVLAAAGEKSLHEEKLEHYFSTLQMPADLAGLDRPVCIMVFTNRSGSNVLAEYLRASHRFTGFVESLNFRRVLKYAEQYQFSEFHEYLQWQVSGLAAEGKIIGIKASVEQAIMLYRCGAIPHYFSNIHWLMVQRNDVLSQAISFSIAAQSKQWTSDQAAAPREVIYNFDDITGRVKQLSAAYSRMNEFFALNDIRPQRVIYEDFISDPKQHVRQIAATMGLTDLEFDEALLKLSAQRDARNGDFRERFIEDYGRSRQA